MGSPTAAQVLGYGIWKRNMAIFPSIALAHMHPPLGRVTVANLQA